MNDEMLEATLPQTMTTPTSDCPRTDAVDKSAKGQSWENQYRDLSSFACTLERELNEANKEADKEHAKAVELSDKLIEYRQVASELEEALKDANGAIRAATMIKGLNPQSTVWFHHFDKTCGDAQIALEAYKALTRDK